MAHRIRKGLDIPIDGRPMDEPSSSRMPRRVGLVAADYVGIHAVADVVLGEQVLRGQSIWHDRRSPEVKHTAPAAGEVVAIEHEAHRVTSVVIEVADEHPEAQAALPSVELTPTTDAGRVRDLLLQSGLWTSIRARPFSTIPAADAPAPAAIFVNGMDTHPLAARPEAILKGRGADLEVGLRALGRLTEGPVFLCRAEGSSLGDGTTAARIEEFDGPHPAGTTGLHIHTLLPVDRNRSVWHLAASAAARIGRLFADGELDTSRTIALVGPEVERPRLVHTWQGASLHELTEGELGEGEHRIISGSVLSGRAVSDPHDAFLGHYHDQVCVLREGGERQFLGWLRPGFGRFSATRLFAPFMRRVVSSTSSEGALRPIIPIGVYERVMPMDLLPTHLLRALVVGDLETAEELGCLELDEEDLDLCSFVCPGKIEYGPHLRRVLNAIEAGE